MTERFIVTKAWLILKGDIPARVLEQEAAWILEHRDVAIEWLMQYRARELPNRQYQEHEWNRQWEELICAAFDLD